MTYCHVPLRLVLHVEAMERLFDLQPLKPQPIIRYRLAKAIPSRKRIRPQTHAQSSLPCGTPIRTPRRNRDRQRQRPFSRAETNSRLEFGDSQHESHSTDEQKSASTTELWSPLSEKSSNPNSDRRRQRDWMFEIGTQPSSALTFNVHDLIKD